ncbi:MAG: D-aminoacyl-tRNA deacylase, partial [Candidatus Anstonellales archaeon]
YILTGKNDVFAAKNILSNFQRLLDNENLTDIKFIEVENALKVTDNELGNLIEMSHNDFIVVPSKHKSESKYPCLTAHFPGNPCDVSNSEMGGESKKLNKGFATLMQKYVYNLFHEVTKEKLEIDVVIEQDHHGPTINLPIMFIEIGSEEENWKNESYGKVIASALLKTLKEIGSKSESYKSEKSYIAIGNTHYPKKFTEMLLNQEYKFSHVFSKYTINCIDKNLLHQAIEKSIEKIQGFVIDKKSLKASEKEKILNIINSFETTYEKIFV